MVTHYHSASRGPVEIASMQYDHAKNALAKLRREGGDPEIIAAIEARMRAVEATFVDRQDG